MTAVTDIAQGKADGAPWAAGVDLGGTKVEVAQMDRAGRLLTRLRRPTDVKDGSAGFWRTDEGVNI